MNTTRILSKMLKINILLILLVPSLWGAPLLDQAKRCADHQFPDQSQEISTILDELAQHHVYGRTGGDELRTPFVLTQACLEHVMTCALMDEQLEYVAGVIHTPTPATPLCTLPDPLDTSVLAPEIRDDAEKRLTVSSRAQILRDFLGAGGWLSVVYPEDGLSKRSKTQQAIFHELCAAHPNTLFDRPMPVKTLPGPLVGATYFLSTPQGEYYVFSIKAHQANAPAKPKPAPKEDLPLPPEEEPAPLPLPEPLPPKERPDDTQPSAVSQLPPQEGSEPGWTLWFGPVEHPVITERLHELYEGGVFGTPPSGNSL